jgi:hypothetical protein
VEQRAVGLEIDVNSGAMLNGGRSAEFGNGVISIFVSPSDYDRPPGEQFDYERWKVFFGGVVKDVLDTALRLD